VEWPRTKRDAFLALGLVPPRGILLHGPPGCGKTSLARAAAGASGIAFFSLGPADVYSSSYVGEAEAVIRSAFSLARSAAPCILFFDEIDSILGSPGGADDGGNLQRGKSAEARVLSTFLNEMDGIDASVADGVLVLGATNRPWTLDAALLRPGRFDHIIYVANPDFEGCRALLQQQVDKWNTDGAIDIDYLARHETEWMTGAEIVGACREAAMNVLRRAIDSGNDSTLIVTQDDLVTALRAVRPLLSNRQVFQEYARFEEQRRHQHK
jgi:SpoVK/Ycf46/Vps4 family AAA+-type ATPase